MMPPLPTPAVATEQIDALYDEAQLIAYGRAVAEACAVICDTTPPSPFRPSIEAAHAIRKMAKDKP